MVNEELPVTIVLDLSLPLSQPILFSLLSPMPNQHARDMEAD